MDRIYIEKELEELKGLLKDDEGNVFIHAYSSDSDSFIRQGN